MAQTTEAAATASGKVAVLLGALEVAGYMTTPQAAALLDTPELNVRRLIARGRLKAVQLGTDGDFRIDSQAMRAYLAGDLQDFEMPALEGRWFNGGETVAIALAFTRALAAEVKANGATMKKGSTSIVVTSGMMRIAAEPVRYSKMDRGPHADFADQATAYYVGQLRSLLGRQLRTRPTGALAALYASPDDYERLTADAMTELASKRLTFNLQGAAVGLGGMYVAPTIYAIDNSDLLTSARQFAVLTAAF